jgi:hypothetical protein
MAFLHKSQSLFPIVSQTPANVSQNVANIEVTFATGNRGEKFEFATFTELALKFVRLFLHLFYTNKSHWLLVTLSTSLLHDLLVDPRSDSLDHTN